MRTVAAVVLALAALPACLSLTPSLRYEAASFTRALAQAGPSKGICAHMATAFRDRAVRTPQMAVGRYTISEGLFGAPSTSQLQPLRATSVTEADAGTETGVATAIRNGKFAPPISSLALPDPDGRIVSPAVAVAMRTLSKLFAFLAVLPFFKAATAEKEVVMDEPMAMESVVVEEEEVVVKPGEHHRSLASYLSLDPCRLSSSLCDNCANLRQSYPFIPTCNSQRQEDKGCLPG